MAWMFHVFVEGARDASPQGLEKLAQAIAAHYGIDAAGLLARLKAGRFRVKGNVDRATADSYLRDLERLGARCVVEAATAANSYPTPPAGVPVTTLPPVAKPTAPPATKTATPPAGSPAAKPNQFSSGLSAAFSGDMPQSDASAYDKLGGALSLAAVDGSEGSGPVEAPASFEPPPAAAPAAKKPAAPAKQPEKKARPKDEPMDLFVPPDAGGEGMSMDLAPEDNEVFSRKKASTPTAPSPAVQTPASPEQRKSQPLPAMRQSQPMAVQPRPAPRGGAGTFADERVRFVAGVLLAILLGFVPAHFIARVREHSVYADIDQKVEAAQSQITTQDEYAALEKRRTDFLDEKNDARRNIAILAFLIWGAAGAAIAYVWFRRIPWDQSSSDSSSSESSA